MDNQRIEVWMHEAHRFRFLARGLQCPDGSTVAAIVDGSFLQEAAQIVDNCELPENLHRVFSDLSKEIEAIAEEDTLLSLLRKEHTRLFTSPSGSIIPIWESVFLDPHGEGSDFGAVIIRSAEAVDARRRYEAAGVRVANAESPDHMGIECEFVGYLCEHIGSSGDKVDEMLWKSHLEGFLESHLNRWYDDFFDTLGTESHCSYFRMMAFLSERRELLQLIS